jgi:LysR family transcriptional regulator, low CO2-responsive transcriptional regulator
VLDVESCPVMRRWNVVCRKGKRLFAAATAFRQFVLTEAHNV